MSVLPVYRDLLAIPPGLTRDAFADAFNRRCWQRHRPLWEGMQETFGPALLGPGGVQQLVRHVGPAVRTAIGNLAAAHAGAPEQHCADLLAQTWPSEWGAAPDCYVATLFGLGPAATLSVQGQPALAIGLERFVPDGTPEGVDPELGPARAYRLADLAEMIPHEGCHVARFRMLGLAPIPHRLPLLELIALEGTALWFSDERLGRQTLRSFMPTGEWERHQRAEVELLQSVVPRLGESGPQVYLGHFSALAPVSGYYLGWAICRRFLERQGGSAAAMASLPAAELWAGAGLPPLREGQSGNPALP